MASDEERWSDSVAPAWERYREQLFEAQRNVSQWLIDQVDPRPGQTVLELAAGPGETGFLAAERVGPTGTVISTDLGSGMVDAARRGAAARGLANVEFRVMDAQENDLANGSVDAVVCRFGIMLMPAPEMALRHARRVLRDGGRVAYAVWGPPDRNPWLAMLAMAVVQNGHQPPGDPFAAGGVFSRGGRPERGAARVGRLRACASGGAAGSVPLRELRRLLDGADGSVGSLGGARQLTAIRPGICDPLDGLGDGRTVRIEWWVRVPVARDRSDREMSPAAPRRGRVATA